MARARFVVEVDLHRDNDPQAVAEWLKRQFRDVGYTPGQNVEVRVVAEPELEFIHAGHEDAQAWVQLANESHIHRGTD